MRKILITGSSGLIGAELVSFFAEREWKVFGVDNNMREAFFGPEGNTDWNLKRLIEKFPHFHHFDFDIRDREDISGIVRKIKPDAIVHAAAQPSHDWASKKPLDDFDINAVGTLNLLEASRLTNPDVPFVFLSSNKVYGDAINNLKLEESATRWDYADKTYHNGIKEDFGIDRSKHSVFGASKLAADIMVQEYGRFFGMPSCCLRCGCLTGPGHSGVELHGFLSFLIKCHMENRTYKINGYKGKQVRDNLHSLDVALFIDQFLRNPRIAEIYNLGGGRENSISILEAFDLIESISGKKMRHAYSPKNREGDHICYISDLSKAKKDFPSWSVTKDLKTIFEEISEAWLRRNGTAGKRP
jgi:CDP-paratose 2-epimerase